MIAEIRKAENQKLVNSVLRSHGGRCCFGDHEVAELVWHRTDPRPPRRAIEELLCGASGALLLAELQKYRPACRACLEQHHAAGRIAA